MVEFTIWDILRNLLLAARWTIVLALIAFAGGALVGGARTINDLLGNITVAAEEQNNGVKLVGDAVNDLSQMTRQNATLVEQTAASSESLKQQANDLVQVVARFRIPAHANHH